MKRINAIIFAIGFAGHCTSNGIVDKLETPSSGTTTSASNKLYIFVSSRSTQGNMSELNNGNCAGGGLVQADCSCNDSANAAGFVKSGISKYVAWLSDSSSNMKCRIFGATGNGCEPGAVTQTWYNTRNEIVAVGHATLFSGALAGQIKYTESLASASGNVWTGTNSNGTSTGNHCSNWSSNAAGNGTNGDIGANSPFWTSNGAPGCSTTLPVYCIAVPQ